MYNGILYPIKSHCQSEKFEQSVIDTWWRIATVRIKYWQFLSRWKQKRDWSIKNWGTAARITRSQRNEDIPLLSLVERDGRCFAYYVTKTTVQISQHVDISAVVRGYSYRVAISVVVEDIIYNSLANIDSINYNYAHSKTECSVNLQKLPRFSSGITFSGMIAKQKSYRKKESIYTNYYNMYY